MSTSDYGVISTSKTCSNIKTILKTVDSRSSLTENKSESRREVPLFFSSKEIKPGPSIKSRGNWETRTWDPELYDGMGWDPGPGTLFFRSWVLGYGSYIPGPSFSTNPNVGSVSVNLADKLQTRYNYVRQREAVREASAVQQNIHIWKQIWRRPSVCSGIFFMFWLQ